MPSRRLHRVFLLRAGARAGEPGHPLHVPASRQGRGRIDNPDLYSTLYVSDAPAGAVAEAFGRIPMWTTAMFSVSDAVRALVTYRLSGDDRVLDLDDPAVLASHDIRPSRVVTRDRVVTQAWAYAIYRERRWAGVRWWSYYDSKWASVGLWDMKGLHVLEVEPLGRDHPAVEEAGEVLARAWID